MAEPPTLASAIGLPGPVFLRKLRRRADWGSNETPLEERAVDLVGAVWKCEPHPESPYSVYRVQTDEELQRVVIGMNGGRLSLTVDSDFIALLPDDLEAVGVRAERCDGVTLCRFTNALHYDLPAEDGQLLDLCRGLIRRGSTVIHLTKGMLKPLAERARSEGCLVTLDATKCRVERCA